MWGLVGLLLMIQGALVQASMVNGPWQWPQVGILVYNLGETFQVGTALLVGAMGGATAGCLAQVAYLVVGLTQIPVFTFGGSWSYLREPTLGYLLGFVPGSTLCGYLAFRLPLTLENLLASCLAGLGAIHLVGLTYLASQFPAWADWSPLAWQYTLTRLPAQLLVSCSVAALSWGLRRGLWL